MQSSCAGGEGYQNKAEVGSMVHVRKSGSNMQGSRGGLPKMAVVPILCSRYRGNLISFLQLHY